MLYRHSVLVLKCLQTHPQFRDPESRKAFRPLGKRIDRVIEGLEDIKPLVEAEYAEWERMTPATSKAAQSKPSTNSSSYPSSYGDFAARDPSLSGNATILDASENQELAVELAQKELARRDTVRQANRHARVYGDTLLSSRTSQSQKVDLDLQSQMEAVRRATDSSHRDSYGNQEQSTRRPTHDATPQHYMYPSVSQSRPIDYDASRADRSSLAMPPPPGRPPKEHMSILPPRESSRGPPNIPSRLPEVPSKLPFADRPTYPPTPAAAVVQPPLPPKAPVRGPPPPKKERLAFKPGAYLENGDPIRSIFLPSKLRSAFLDVAAENTRKGLEMCGILCGTPINNALFVRCLLIPDQKCTSDTCETENESAVFDYCSGEDLMVLGWIHTHPTQTCFMSSRDLHTHAGYQVMMPESIAIVCAPKFTPS